MWIKTTCRLELDYFAPTAIILMLRARSGAGQWISKESWDFSESIAVNEYTDLYGNLCQKLIVPANGFVIETEALVQTSSAMDVGTGAAFVDVLDLPDEVLPYLLPSRYCESDRFGQQAFAASEGCTAGYDQVQAISKWISDNVHYTPGSSSIPQSAEEIAAQGNGVCKDLAHLGIAMCRSISIPARFVVGYLHNLEPMDLHAWFEAWVGGRWYTFDATQKTLDGARVAVAYGRDAADVSIYHQFGPAARHTDMKVTVAEVSGS